MVKLANLAALSLALVGLQTSNASPIETEGHQLVRRTTSLRCGKASKHGIDMGCMCDIPGISLDLDLDFGGFPILDLFLGTKQYPPGCKPTCDDKVYECPHGYDDKGGCKEPMKCPPNHCESYGKCCPYGTQNTDGICCPKGCVKKDNKCHVPEPEPKCTGENEEVDHYTKKCRCKDGFEYFKDKCVAKCPGGPHEYKRNEAGHCECKQEGYKPDHEKVCRPQCTHPKEIDTKSNTCKCPGDMEEAKDGTCFKPPYCHAPEKLSHDKMTCVCEYPAMKDEHGVCFLPPDCHYPKKLSHDKKSCVDPPKQEPPKKDCGEGKKWCRTRCCRKDQEEKDDGSCGCPYGTKSVLSLLGLEICKKISVLGINL